MWRPVFAQVFGVQPWMMGRFRVGELNDMITYLNEATRDA